jgi:hypothetical protein
MGKIGSKGRGEWSEKVKILSMESIGNSRKKHRHGEKEVPRD